jgi:hypothetical protein
MIEPAWNYLKRKTTEKGAPRTREAMEKAWLEEGEQLPQAQIQAWIERIPVHIQEILRLEGGSGYREGRSGEKKHTIWLKGKLSKMLYRDREAEDSECLIEKVNEEEDEDWEHDDSGLGLQSDEE